MRTNVQTELEDQLEIALELDDERDARWQREARRAEEALARNRALIEAGEMRSKKPSSFRRKASPKAMH